jgi:hypothetical protein
MKDPRLQLTAETEQGQMKFTSREIENAEKSALPREIGIKGPN